jgi:hypothetical protein
MAKTQAPYKFIHHRLSDKPGYVSIVEKWGPNKQWTRNRWVKVENAHKYSVVSFGEESIQKCDPNNPERISCHSNFKHPANLVHDNDEDSIEHRDEQIKYSNMFYGEKSDWITSNNISFKELRVTFGDGTFTDACKYFKGSDFAYLIESGMTWSVYINNISKGTYTKERDALECIKAFFINK